MSSPERTDSRPPSPPLSPPLSPMPMPMGRVNWIGLWTLYKKEVLRFVKVGLQTVIAPVVTTMLFLAIFTLALGGAGRTVGDLPFVTFLAPGLIMMSIIQNAFANTSSSVLISKIQGNIVDVLMPPLSAGEFTLAYVMGGVSRGLAVAAAVFAAMLFFVDLEVRIPLLALYYAFGAAMMLSLLGMIGGMWADKFDHMSALTNFVIMPLSFLSGTFYSIERLPGFWNTLTHFNPFFYMIDGFRYAFLGRSDAPIEVGMAVVLGINLALYGLCHRLVARGYKLKA